MQHFKFLLIMPIIAVLFLTAACQNSQMARFDTVFDHLTQNYGGQTITYTPSEDSEVPEMLLSLYSRAGEVPDELKMVRSAKIWYGETLNGGDLAVFELFNATDSESVKKMCIRRANTLKYSVHLDSVTITDGHFVIYINEGNFEGLEREVSPFLKKQDSQESRRAKRA